MKIADEKGGGGGDDWRVPRRREEPSKEAKTPEEGTGKQNEQESPGPARRLGSLAGGEK